MSTRKKKKEDLTPAQAIKKQKTKKLFNIKAWMIF